MPSPFPGMDPYLEGTEWGGAHVALCAQIARQLAPLVRPRYVVRTMRRFAVDSDDVSIEAGSMYPDVTVTPRRRLGEAAARWDAVPVRMTLVMAEPAPQVSVEIRDAAGQDLVTAIELLSLANKQGQGRADYLAKRRRLLLSPAHLVEIDLLRSGRRPPMVEPPPPTPYLALVSRAEDRPTADVWPIRLDVPLPTIPIPLRAPDPDVPLDLQAALTAVYDDLGYDLSLDYAHPPDVPLLGADATWARELLAEAGRLRTKES